MCRQYIKFCNNFSKNSKVLKKNADIHVTKGKNGFTKPGKLKGKPTMGLNVSTSMGFENRDFLKSAAEQIIQKSGAESEKANQIAEKAVFDTRSNALKTQFTVLNSSAQITLNNSLKETLKYLRAHANETKHKKYVLGELWNVFSANNEASEKNPYRGELYDFEIDKNVKNIFAA